MRFAMNRFRLRTAGLSFVAVVALPSTALAQYIGAAPPPPAAPIPGMIENPTAALARNVRLLAMTPRSFEALIGAGRAALALGDTQAAVGFFGRAEEVNPRHPAPKAGTGAALVAMEQPNEALGYFEEAVRLGANQASIGADRGLAYDLTGEPARAQADYRAALYGQDRDEARRRLALSLAMGKDRAGALAAIAPLMSRRDPATERVRAFVLALVGDVAGARQVVEAAMPGASANMAPFLYKLARMNRDQAAAAVHFGRFPDDSAIRMAAVSPPPIPAPATRYPVARSAPPPGLKPAAQTKVAAPPAHRRAAPRRFGQDEPDLPIRRPVPKAVAARPVAVAPPPREAPRISSSATPTPEPLVTAAVQGPPAPARSYSPAPGFAMTEVPLQPPPPVDLAAASSTPAVDRLSEIDNLLQSTDEPIVNIATASTQDELAPDALPGPTKPKTEAAKKAGAKKAKAEEESASAKKAKAAAKALKSPGKYWVQLAGGAKTERMPIEFKRIKGKKPALFAKRNAYVAELKGWTRLLVGPFKSEDESQEYVNQLAKADIDGFSWTGPTGQAIEKLPPK